MRSEFHHTEPRSRFTVFEVPCNYGYAVLDTHSSSSRPVFYSAERRFCEWAIHDHVEKALPFPDSTEPAYNRVLELIENGKRTFFAVPTYKSLLKVALSIVRGRCELGYYGKVPEEPTVPAIPREQIEAMPASRMRKAGLQEWDEYEIAVADYESAIKVFDNLEAARKDGFAALSILLSRVNSDPNKWAIHCMSESYT